jgi:Ca-activated chloride channel family protein
MKRTTTFLVLLLIAIACSTNRPVTPTNNATLPTTGNATVSGHAVLDGYPLPGATVTIIDPVAGWRTVVTDAAGAYRFANVPPGQYTVKFEMSGMSTVSRRVTVGGSAMAVANGTLRLGSVAEAITVTASAPSVLESTGVGFTIAAPAPPVMKVANVSGGVAGGIIGTSYAYDAKLPEPQYATIKEHEYIEAAKEATTTFAIDVDRASYTNVRRFLTANQMPPPDAVRIEEMINYFSYSYPQPTGPDPFSVTSEVSGCPWDVTHRLVRIGIQGRNLDEWKMAPNNLVFLLDVSGSMMPPERLPLIKSAFRVLVNRLRAEDTVSIVVYAGAAGLVLPATSGADKRTILDALDHLQAGGSTAGAEGIELAYKVAKDNFKSDGNNRVILATDGDFNVGINSMDDLGNFIEEKRKSGIFLTTIGVGDDNYRDSVLELLADKGNGNYSYLDTPKEADKVFKTELTGTLVTIAKDVKVQIEFDPSRVKSYRQIGYENRALANKDFADDTKDAGELGAGHSVTALYEIVPNGNTNGEIAEIRLRYKEPKEETSKLLESKIVDNGTSAYAASPDMQFAAAVAEFGMLLRNSPHKGTAKFADVAALARAARGADLEGYREELLRMVDTGRALSGESGRIAAK